MPPRTSRTSRRATAAEKGKAPALNDSSSDDEHERRTKKSQDHREGSDQWEEVPDDAYPTSQEVFSRAMGMNWVGTRYADLPLLSFIGILGEVQELFQEMGLTKFHTLVRPTYKAAACQFISSLEVRVYTDNEQGNPYYGDGFIEFTIGKTVYHMGFNQLNEIFGFERGQNRGAVMEAKKGEHEGVWAQIGVGEYKPGVCKAALIKHPAIRYVHKVLANTFYQRKESNTILDEEMIMLCKGMKENLMST